MVQETNQSGELQPLFTSYQQARQLFCLNLEGEDIVSWSFLSLSLL